MSQTESTLPIPKARLNAFRPKGELYDDVSIAIRAYLNFYSRIEKVIAPYNSRNSSSHLPYVPMSRQQLIDIIGQRNLPKNLNEITVNDMINSSIKFCERYKGKRQLPAPHHSTHHSLQFRDNQFLIEEFNIDEWQKMSGTQEFKISNVYQIILEGFKPFFIENFKPQQYKYLILRQKLSKTGVPSTDKWEVLLFKNNMNYVIDWVDAELNTRYVGII